MNETSAEWLEGYKEEIGQIFAEAAKGLQGMPTPLAAMGIALLDRCNPLSKGEAGTNYICFLLPAWLKEQTGCADELCRDLAIGNAYAMLHFFLLDDAMDANAAAADRDEKRRALALGQLLNEAFRRRYGKYFSATSPLWERYEVYLAEWASAVSGEGERPAEPSDPKALARKSAPVKLCAAGMLMLSGQEQLLSRMEEGLDLVLASLQLSDDWADWREDLAEGGERRNAFLTLVRRMLAVPPEETLDERTVKRGIYRDGCLRRLYTIAEGYQARLDKLRDVPRTLLIFHADIVSGLRKDAEEAEAFTEKLATEGGLSEILSILANS